ncbi:glycoside hydrolase family 127 protein [Agromyces larvae]|uniref:Glycoside hydrolase family 127 protein n=1 Tax=Agromyces larvae TaxID=2929802 RepID=A0ABY4BZ04_9MICO|nr:beta-L-arabinofuranosidase domain-containing protein [Agromyces larvae]UOE42926.1 glycoside hydrolase family 127 protein [Agromyces larvae]
MTLTATTAHLVPVAPSSGALRPLGLDEVRITGGFWHRRQEVNGTNTLDHIEGWLEREGWLGNFDLAAAGTLPEGRRGREFSDSEVYKYLEAVAWELGRLGALTDPDASERAAALEARFRAIVARVAAAQEPDGYLNTRFGRPGQGARWSDLEWGHELYCLGHLFQAAVARHRTRPDADDGLVDIARRAADLVCEVFGDGGIERICGHAEVEVGLAELGRALGEPRYLTQAALFVERHGRGTLADIEWGRSYYQDDVAVRDASALRGHSVRANYLAAGAADVAVETGDDGLLDALARQWDATVERRTYVTGGQGSHHQDEAFGEDWELPADRAYSETCAGVASVMFSWRLLLATGDAKYADLVERTLFNVVETSPAEDGRAFYYANTLHQRVPGAPADPDAVSPRAHSSLRAPWFDVSCCPPNTARTFASLAGYLATADASGIQLHQYAPSTVRTRLDDGREVALEVETGYPVDGRIVVRVLADAPTPWRLSLRVPAWATGAALVLRPAGEALEQRMPAGPGMVSCERAWAAGDEVELSLPVAPRFTSPDPRIDAVRGCLVVERGPEVFALETVDLDGTVLAASDFADLHVDPTAPPRDLPDGGVAATIVDRRTGARAEVPLVPYHAWAERGPSQMRVWVPGLPPVE